MDAAAGGCRGRADVDILLRGPVGEKREDRTAVELKEILQASRVNPADIAGLSYDCTACTVTALTADGEPLRPALLWMDERAYEEADDISATGHEILKYCGGKVSPQWMLAKGRWLERHEPDVFRRAR